MTTLRIELARYFVAGTFDSGDLVATTLGTAVAVAVLLSVSRHREMSDA